MLDAMVCAAERMLERNVAPDWVVRAGIRRLLASRLQEESSANVEEEIRHKMSLIQFLRKSEIAVEQDVANEQHYELPTDFFLLHLGKRLKYSAAYYESSEASLDDAEEVMLRMYCQRTGLRDGMTVLDLGCGWGSLTLYVAQHYPKCRIISVSNSATQQKFIEQRAKEGGYKNVKTVKADVTTLDKIEGGMTFDAIISVEMFEHMRNYEALLNKVSRWLKKNGVFFAQIFCHNKFIYCMDTEGPTNWLGRYFFTGGTMPCDDVFSYFQKDLYIADRWRVDGRHYAQTAEHWLQNFDKSIDKIRPILRNTYKNDAVKWEAYWRTFYMSVAELFGYNNGQEWHVAHYLFRKR